MISTATKVKFKRSGVAGRIPTLDDLQLGEMGINYNDGKIYIRQENETVGARIIEPGQSYRVGKTIFVTVLGNDNNSGLNDQDAKRSIKAAAAIAEPGDSIKVYPGQYVEDNPITFKDRVSVEGMELRNVLITPANPEKDLYLVGDGFHATNHSFVSNVDSRDGAAIISFRPLEGTASDRYFDAARLIRDNLDFIANESVGFLTSGYSGYAAGQRSQDGARSIDLNRKFISEEAFQYINSPDYKGPDYTNPDINQCRKDLNSVLDGWIYDLIADGNSGSVAVGLTYYAPIPFVNSANITDLVYNQSTGELILETDIDTQTKAGDEIKLADIRLECDSYDNAFFISGFEYKNTDGTAVVTLPFIHDIQIGDTIKLDGLQFDCPPYGAASYTVADFKYNELSGSSVIKLTQNHGLSAGDRIELRDLQFDCPAYDGTFTNVVDLEYNNISGTGLISFEDPADLQTGDSIFLYDITLTCPSYGNAISIAGFEYDNFTGQSEIQSVSPHGLQPGDLVKLEDLKFSCESYLDESYQVTNFVYNEATGQSEVTLSTNHSFTTGETITLDGMVFTCNSYQPTGKSVVSFNYDNNSGVSTITLAEPHNLSVDEQFRLEDLVFSCNSYSFTDIAVVDAAYDNVTGFVTLDLAESHGQEVGERVRLADIEYSCPGGSGITTTLFPDGTYGYEFEILATPSSTALICNVGVSTIQHSYVAGGTATVGITTTVFPDGTTGFDYTVSRIINSNTVETNVGVSTIAHTYASGGQLFVGFTTTVFPDGTQGFDFEIDSIPAANKFGINAGISSIAHQYVSGGTATSQSSALSITNFVYNSSQGTGLITLASDHNLVVGDNFIAEDIKFSCDSYQSASAKRIVITDVVYDEATGLATIDLDDPHNLIVNDTVALFGITFNCVEGTKGYPDGSQPNFYDVVATPTPNSIIAQVGVSSIVHTYVGGGELQVGITTNIFPDGTRPSDNIFKVISVPASNQVLTEVGISSINHTYASGGKFYTGITTNIFPETFIDPNNAVVNAIYDNATGITTITTQNPHGLITNEPVLLEGLEFSCNSGGVNGAPGRLVFPRNQEVYFVDDVIDSYTYSVQLATSDFAHTYVSDGLSTKENISDAVYDRVTGELTVTTKVQHGYSTGDKSNVSNLIFSCLSGGTNNQPGNLIFPRPNDKFEVLSKATSQEFTVDVGAFPGLVHTYRNGGSVKFQGTSQPVINAIYNEDTGVLTVSLATALAADVGETITLQGLNFFCLSGGIDNDPNSIIFPRLDVTYYEITRVDSDITYTINVGPSTLAHTYVSGGFSTLKKKANQGNIFRVLGVPTPDKIITNVGVSSIAHDYVSGGNLFVGITTNIFPDGTRPEGSRFEVLSTPSPNSALINIGVSTIPHEYESGGRMQYGTTNERPILAFDYSNFTGLAVVTVRGNHELVVGDLVKLKDLEFECENSPGITTSIFPDGTAASLNLFPVRRIINSSTFECNIGRVSFSHTYVSGGSAFVGITTNIFPDGTQGYEYIVDKVVSPTEVSVNVGISSIQHNYIRGGQLFAGRSNEREIFDFTYDNGSGFAILTFRTPEDLVTGDLVKLQGLEFTCPDSTRVTTNIFPDGSIGNLFSVTQALNPTQFQLEIGTSDIEHNYVQGTGAAFVGITTNIFPDGTRPSGKLFQVIAIPSPNKLSVEVGISSIQHNYLRGGQLQVGVNTDIFPGDNQVSPKGDIFTVQQVTTDGELIINVGTSTITHTYSSGGKMFYGESAGGQLQHIAGPGVLEATVGAIDFETDISRSVINNRPFGSLIVAETSKVNGIEYDNVTGFATITASGINVQRGDMIRMSDIQFKCSDEYAGLTTTFFPDNTRPQGQYFTVDNRVDQDTFETFIGISTIDHNYSRGGNVYRYRQNVKNVDYDGVSGLASVRSIGHGFLAEDVVEMGDMKFDCPVFTPEYFIENFQYDNTTGLSTVTTTVDNTLEVGDRVKLADIQFECPPYGSEKDITSFIYENTTGVSTVVTLQPHGVTLGNSSPIGINTATYDNVSGILTVVTNTDINIESISRDGVILAGLGFTCTTEYAGLTTTTFPEEEGFIYNVDSIKSPSEFSVNVGVSTIAHEYVSSGTARKVKKTSISLADLRFDCPSYGNELDLSNFLYDNVSGNSLITLTTPHDLSVGDEIKLSDIKFLCPPYGNDYDVVDAEYDGIAGELTVTTNKDLRGIGINDEIRVNGLQFDCTNSGSQYTIRRVFFSASTREVDLTVDPAATTTLQVGDPVKLTNMEYLVDGGPGQPNIAIPYPDGRDPSLNIFEVKEIRDGTGADIGKKIVQVVFNNVTEFNALFFENFGTMTVGVTTNIYPENVGPEGGIYNVKSFPAPNQFVVNVGVNTIPHEYIRYGEAFTGVTTSIFPSPSTQNSPKGNIFPVIDIPTPTQLRINVGTSTIPHTYDSGGTLSVGITTNIFPDGTQGNIFPVIGISSTNILTLNVGVSSIPHDYIDGGQMFTGITTNIFPGDEQNSPLGSIFTVLAKDNECGADRFTINVGVSSIAHNYVEGGTVTTGVTTDRFPDGTFGFEFPILDVLDNDNFLVNVGTSTITHNYISGGFVRRTEAPVRGFFYDNASGISTITVDSHKLNVGDLVKLRDVKFNCDPYGGEQTISNFIYDNTTGRATVSVTQPHGLAISDNVKLSDIQMDCTPYGNQIDITAASYNKDTGVIQLALTSPHNLSIDDDVKLEGLDFSCSSQYAGLTTTTFPDGTAASLNIFPVINIANSTTISVQVGTSTISHVWAGGGSVFVGVTTNIFPGSAQNSPKGSIYPVIDTPSSSSFTVDVGLSSITHSYIQGGLVQTGVTTDIFPDGSQGDYFVVRDVIDADTFEIEAGISTISHRYNSGGFISKYATYQSRFPQVIDNRVIRAKGDCTAVGARVQQLSNIVTSILEEGPSVAPGGVKLNVVQANYNGANGDLTITTSDPIAVSVDNIVEVENIIFSCSSQGFVDTKVFPDNNVNLYRVKRILSQDTFVINVGTSDIDHAYVSGGTVAPGLYYNVVNAEYDRSTGELVVDTLQDHNLVEDTGVNLEGLEFSCLSGGPNNQPGTLTFPDTSKVTTVVASSYDNVTGIVRVETNRPHQLYRDAPVRLEGLEYGCVQGVEIYPENPDELLRVSAVINSRVYEVQLKPSTLVHTYIRGGTSNAGLGNYRVEKVISEKQFSVMMDTNNLAHTYVQGGKASSVFAVQELPGINLRTSRCAQDVKDIYLAVAHDITRGGNWKCVEAASKYYDALGQVKFISGGEIEQTITTLDFSLNVVRNVINNVSWGGVPRGTLNFVEEELLALPPRTPTSVVDFERPLDQGEFTTEKKFITTFDYDNNTGLATVTTNSAHELLKYDAIQLSGIEFDCPNSNIITTNIFPDGTQGEIFEVDTTIQDNPYVQVGVATYNNTTGELTLSTIVNHNIVKDSKIRLENLRFTCDSGTKIYPDNFDYVYNVNSVPTPRTVSINVGVSTLTHTWNPVFTPIVGAEPRLRELSTKFTVHVGTVDFAHNYVGGGTVWRRAPFQRPSSSSQLRDVSIQDDPIQRTNSTPNACANVFSAIDNCIGVVTSIVGSGLENSGISIRYPGNDGKGVATFGEMSSQGVGNIVKGPYIRNCTNFVPKSIGMRMDGFDAEPGDEISNGVQGSSNVDSFTQFNPGGIGCSVSNGTYQQLVSIFTICCDQAIVADSGAQLDLTNSNSSFGRLGLVARGIGDARSKCIDRYTGIVAKDALIEDDTVIISGVGEKRPYDGQGIFFGQLFREVVSIRVTDQGSGYDDRNPPVATIALPTGPSGIKAEVSPTVRDGKVVSIEVISNGNQYIDATPLVTIAAPKAEDGAQAAAVAITEPLYYDVDSSTDPVQGTTTVVFKQRLNNTVSIGTTVFFSRLSLQIASSHSFEYIGAGNSIDGARPSQGGVPIKENEVIKEDGGSVIYTSTDQAGNFNIGDDFVINQFTGTVTGRSFDQSVLNKVTPLIIALDS